MGSDKRPPFPDHRGLATWGESTVPLDEFRRASAERGTRLSSVERDEARKRFRQPAGDRTNLEGPFERIAVLGGVYSNHHGLAALLEDARRRKVDAIYCLGDLGGFGPNPEKVRPLLEQGDVLTIQGNYEQALSGGLEDCNCGYTDPRDNHFAELSYNYTRERCSEEFKRWMGHLPSRRRVRVGGRELLLVHGSPRQVNEFLFYSTSSSAFLDRLMERERCDAMLCTHTGLHWHRRLPTGRDAINVGAIGRPANDGTTQVWYTLVESRNDGIDVQMVPLRYDHQGLIEEMRTEGLPDPFIETIRTGWWTTCLEILPAKERSASRF